VQQIDRVTAFSQDMTGSPRRSGAREGDARSKRSSVRSINSFISRLVLSIRGYQKPYKRDKQKPEEEKTLVVFDNTAKELFLESASFIKRNKCRQVVAEGQGMIVDLKFLVGPKDHKVPISMGEVDLNRLLERDVVKKWRQKKVLTHIYVYQKSWALERIEENVASDDQNGALRIPEGPPSTRSHQR